MAEDKGRKVAFITGGGSGIGRASALELNARGATVAVVDLNLNAAQTVAAQIEAGGGRAIALQANVTLRADLDRAVAETERQLGPISILLANAGLATYPAPLESAQDDDFDRIFEVNVKGVWNTVRASVESLKRAGGGSIVLTGSIMGIRPRPGQAAYAASKAAVNNLALSFALDLARYGIRVNAVAPTATNTAMLPMFLGKDHSDEVREAFLKSIPLGRLATPEDIARTIAFLALDDAAYITGTVVPVDGGRAI